MHHIDRVRIYRAIGIGALAVSLLAMPGSAGAAAVGYWHFDADFSDSSGFGTHLS